MKPFPPFAPPCRIALALMASSICCRTARSTPFLLNTARSPIRTSAARAGLLRSDSGVSSLFLYSVRWDSFTEITDQSENGFDSSLGKSLTDCATSHGCTPLFLLSIGQRWLVSRDADGALFACGPLSADDPEIAWLSEAEFLQKHWPYASGTLPLPTGAQVQLQ